MKTRAAFSCCKLQVEDNEDVGCKQKKRVTAAHPIIILPAPEPMHMESEWKHKKRVTHTSKPPKSIRIKVAPMAPELTSPAKHSLDTISAQVFVKPNVPKVAEKPLQIGRKQKPVPKSKAEVKGDQ